MDEQAISGLDALKSARNLLNSYLIKDDDIQKSVNMLNLKIQFLESQEQNPDVKSKIDELPDDFPYAKLAMDLRQIAQQMPPPAMAPDPASFYPKRGGDFVPVIDISTQIPRMPREVVLHRNVNGIVGMGLQHIEKDSYVSWLQPYSAAELSDLRVGDQLLAINGGPVGDCTVQEIQRRFKVIPGSRIVLTVIEKPFEVTVTLEKDSIGRFGFTLKNGKIKDPLDPRLRKHYVLKVNGQSVIELKDKHIQRVIEDAGPIVTLVVVRKPIYDKFVWRLRCSVYTSVSDSSLRGHLDAFF